MLRSSAFLRIGAWASLFEHWRELQGRPEQPDREFTAAVLSAWEREFARNPDVVINEDGAAWVGELADAYVAFGDPDSAYRVVRGAVPRDDVGEVEALVAAQRHAEAVAAADAIIATDDFDTGAASERLLPALTRLRREADAAGRPDLGLAAARAELTLMIELDRPTVFCPFACRTEPALLRVIRDAPEADARRFVKEIDDAARYTDEAPYMAAAEAAIVGWMALGEPENARQIARLWDAKADAQDWRTCTPDGEDFCVRAWPMLYRAGLVEEAFATRNFDPSSAIQLDINDGRGVERLDALIAWDRGPNDWREIMRACINLAHFEKPPTLDIAEDCLERTYAYPAAARELHYDQLPFGSIEAMFYARLAGIAGQHERLITWTERGLADWRAAPDRPLPLRAALPLEAYALARLREAGRLPLP